MERYERVRNEKIPVDNERIAVVNPRNLVKQYFIEVKNLRDYKELE